MVLKEIVAETGKAEEDVKRYYATFWERYEVGASVLVNVLCSHDALIATAPPTHPSVTHTTKQELPNWQPIMDRIRRGEQRIARNKEIRELLDEKVSPHKNPWLTLKINYGPQVRMQTRD